MDNPFIIIIAKPNTLNWLAFDMILRKARMIQMN
jgi:hypothetical protein